jgi:hypothetical protein
VEARTVVMADALFEAALGLALLIGVASGGLGAGDFPPPVGSAAIAVVGCLLLGLAVFLWRSTVSLAALAAGNAVTALGALIWLLAADGFSAAGESLLAVIAVALVCLAATQLAARRT